MLSTFQRNGYFVGYVNEKDGYKFWVPSKHRLMKSPNVDFCPEKSCTTNNTVDLEFHPPEDDRHDVNSQSTCEDEFHSDQEDNHISESDSENDVDEENTHQDDSNDFSLSSPFRKIKRPVKLKYYISRLSTS